MNDWTIFNFGNHVKGNNAVQFIEYQIDMGPGKEEDYGVIRSKISLDSGEVLTREIPWKKSNKNI